MTVAVYNWTWQQGADLVMSLVYKEGPTGSETPVNLTGYSVRMDLVYAGARIFTFNSDDIAEAGVDETGATDNEATLGTDGTINIVVPRDITLPTGEVYAIMALTGNTVINYDIFLRNPAGKQWKILRGTVVVEPSYTLWQ